ncbi:MAG TPA: hypothetical protein VN066_08225 [Rhodocyclaceae bacterium]|jgi:hypothetical protein|nr:hypothetical protein [Rhodocyclaceae bacterium]
MSFIKSFVTKHIHAAAASRPTGMEAIAVFFYGETPAPEVISTVASQAHGADAVISTEDEKIRVKLVWPDVHTVVTIDPTWDKVAHMQGMRGWTERFPAKVRELGEVRALIDSFEQVSACYGTVTRPGLDPDNKVVSLLKSLTAQGGGFFFSRNSFYGTDGLRITGFDEDPVWLGKPPV